MLAALHPFATHFPIASLLFVLLGELYLSVSRKNECLRQGISFLLLAAACTTVIAFVTGLYAAEVADGTFKVPDDAIARHYNYARIALCLVPCCAAFHFVSRIARHNQGVFVMAYRLLLCLAVLIVAYAGYLGGELVFSYGAGVTVPAASEAPKSPI